MMRDILGRRQSLISISTWFWTKLMSTGLDTLPKSYYTK
jgi:hypothetical protein